MDVTSILFPIASLGGLGLVFGLGLGFASKKFAVETDPLVPLVRDALPGANCGGCGYAGCDAFAKAVVEGIVQVNGCPVGGAATAQTIGQIMGITVDESAQTVAYVKCNGTCSSAKEKYIYEGITDCRDAAMIPGAGSKSCSYGCLGLGTCERSCPFGAIDIVDGVAVINEEKCTSCGNCVAACPKNIIEIIPLESKVRVSCNSIDKGKDVKSSCGVGCIGCRMCTKVCPTNAITIENNLAHIDYSLCTQCNACVEKCPTKAIQNLTNN